MSLAPAEEKRLRDAEATLKWLRQKVEAKSGSAVTEHSNADHNPDYVSVTGADIMTGPLNSQEQTTPGTTPNVAKLYVKDVGGVAKWHMLWDDGTETVLGAAGGGGHTIREDTTPLTQRTNLSFAGGLVAADNPGQNSSDITPEYGGLAEIADVAATESAGSSLLVPRADHRHALGVGPPILDEVAALPQRLTLAFQGSGVTAVDNAGAARTEIVIGAYYDAIVDNNDANAKDKGNVYSMLEAAIAAGHTSIFIRACGDVAARDSLSGSMDASQTTVPLNELSGFPTAGTVLIDKEIITYTGKSAGSGAGNLTGGTRGAKGTIAATHASAAKVGTAICIQSSDAVRLLIGEEPVNVTLPVHVICLKADVAIQYLGVTTQDSDETRLVVCGLRDIVFGCAFSLLGRLEQANGNGAGNNDDGQAIACRFVACSTTPLRIGQQVLRPRVTSCVFLNCSGANDIELDYGSTTSMAPRAVALIGNLFNHDAGAQASGYVMGKIGSSNGALSALSYQISGNTFRGLDNGCIQIGGKYWNIAGNNFDGVSYGGTGTFDSGTATAGTATTLTDSSKSWSVNQHMNRWVKITAGTGAGQSRLIFTNTATVLTIVGTWTTTPDATSQYQIQPYQIAIRNDGGGGSSLCVLAGNVFANLRAAYQCVAGIGGLGVVVANNIFVGVDDPNLIRVENGSYHLHGGNFYLSCIVVNGGTQGLNVIGGYAFGSGVDQISAAYIRDVPQAGGVPTGLIAFDDIGPASGRSYIGKQVGKSLGNGNNNDVDPGSTGFMRVTTPNMAFAITGLANGQDGRLLYIYNSTAQVMTIANQDVNSAAGNRFVTPTGANIVAKVAECLYSLADSRWIVMSFA